MSRKLVCARTSHVASGFVSKNGRPERTTDFVSTTIRFTEPQYNWIKEEAAKLGVSAVELLRRIIDERRSKAA